MLSFRGSYRPICRRQRSWPAWLGADGLAGRPLRVDVMVWAAHRLHQQIQAMCVSATV